MGPFLRDGDRPRRDSEGGGTASGIDPVAQIRLRGREAARGQGDRERMAGDGVLGVGELPGQRQRRLSRDRDRRRPARRRPSRRASAGRARAGPPADARTGSGRPRRRGVGRAPSPLRGGRSPRPGRRSAATYRARSGRPRGPSGRIPGSRRRARTTGPTPGRARGRDAAGSAGRPSARASSEGRGRSPGRRAGAPRRAGRGPVPGPLDAVAVRLAGHLGEDRIDADSIAGDLPDRFPDALLDVAE